MDICSKFLREIPDVYDFAFAGEELIGERAAYKITATPRKGARIHTHGPQGNLLRIPGTIWIDKLEGQWVKVETEVPADLHFGAFWLRSSRERTSVSRGGVWRKMSGCLLALRAGW